MIHWRRYPKYKNSGIDWLGEAPVGWIIGRLKFFCTINPSKSEITQLSDDLEVSFLPMENIGEDHSLRLDINKPLSEVWNGYTYFRDCDVILAKITPCFENGKCCVCAGLTNKIGFGTTELHVFRSKNSVTPEFCYYVIQNHAFKIIGTELMFGTTGQKRLPEDFVKDYKQGIPPLLEQTIISAFLNRETTRIDALIAKKERQIKLLQEKQAALISYAVTKGLDPNVKMKDSGVVWLGEIPDGWDVIPLNRCLRGFLDFRGRTPKKLGMDWSKEGIPAISANNVQMGRIDISDVNYGSEELYNKWMTAGDVEKGDVVMTSEAPLGVVAQIPDHKKYILSQRVVLMKVNQQILSDTYLMFFIWSSNFQYYLNMQSTGSTAVGIKMSKFKLSSILIPPLHKQSAIVSFLVRETAQIDNLIQLINESMEQLHEYRTALISAAVTGKIDVRGEVQG